MSWLQKTRPKANQALLERVWIWLGEDVPDQAIQERLNYCSFTAG
jgi:hypothetical protein